MNFFAAIVALGLVHVSTVAGLKCFTCTGETCKDPYGWSNEHQTECTPDLATKAANSVKMAAQKVSSVLESIGVALPDAPTNTNLKLICAKFEIKDGATSRSCAMASEKLDFCDTFKANFGDKGARCSTCDTDLCNGALSPGLGSALTATILLVWLTAYFNQ